jgi:tetratricopeptide (TPR) repeat protein
MRKIYYAVFFVIIVCFIVLVFHFKWKSHNLQKLLAEIKELRWQKKYQPALERCILVENILKMEKQTSTPVYMRVLLTKSQLYALLNDKDKSRSSEIEASKLLHKLAGNSDIVDIYLEYATHEYDSGNYPCAYSLFSDIIDINKRKIILPEMTIANIYSAMSMSARKTGCEEKAILTALKSIEKRKQMLTMPLYQKQRKDNLAAIYSLYRYIIRQLNNSEKFSEALTYFPIVEEYRKNEQKSDSLAMIYLGLARNAQDKGDYEFSDQCCDLGLQISSSSSAKGRLTWLKAYNANLRDKPDKAFLLGTKALSLLNENKKENLKLIEMIKNSLEVLKPQTHSSL